MNRLAAAIIPCLACISCAATPADETEALATTKAALTTLGPFTVGGQSSFSLGVPVSTDLCWLSGIGGNIHGNANHAVQLTILNGNWHIAYNLAGTTATVSIMCTSWASVGNTTSNGNFSVQTPGYGGSAYKSMTTIFNDTNWGYLYGVGTDAWLSYPGIYNPPYSYAEVSRFSGLGLAVQQAGYGWPVIGKIAAQAMFVQGTHHTTSFPWGTTNATQLLGNMSNSVCYLTGIAGSFASANDTVRIAPNFSGQWALISTGNLFARAECIAI